MEKIEELGGSAILWLNCGLAKLINNCEGIVDDRHYGAIR